MQEKRRGHFLNWFVVDAGRTSGAPQTVSLYRAVVTPGVSRNDGSGWFFFYFRADSGVAGDPERASVGSGRTKVLERSYAVLGPPPTPSTRRHRRSRSGGRGGSSRWCRTASSDRNAPRRREKLRTDIHFPRRGLDLSRFLPADAYAVYDLFGVINHLVPTRRPFPRPLHDRQSVDASRVPRRGASRAVTIPLM